MARRSLPGVGQIALIYTIGPDRPALAARPPEPDICTALTASIGEDFAVCGWPVTIKARAGTTAHDLFSYITSLRSAIGRGFFMNPGSGAGVYWRWTGSVPAGAQAVLDHAPPLDDVPRTMDQAAGTGRRSMPGRGPTCGIYLLDEASRWDGDGFYGRIEGNTALSGSIDEDFAHSNWPVVIKVHPRVSRERLTNFMRDFVACLADGFYFDVNGVMRPSVH